MSIVLTITPPRWRALAPLATALWLSACASAPQRPDPDAAAAATVLGHVPPDAAWVVAYDGLAPERFDAALTRWRDAARDVLPEVDAVLAGMHLHGALPAAGERLASSARALSLVAELSSASALDRLGARLPLVAVAYGAPLLPVLRVALASPAKARALLTEHLAPLEGVTAVPHPDGVAWQVTVFDHSLLLAVTADAAVLAVAETPEAALALAFAPARHDGAATRSALRSLATRLDAAGPGRSAAAAVDPSMGLGWLDLGRLAPPVVAAWDAANAPAGAERDPASLFCPRELAEAAATLPRVEFGVTATDADGYGGVFALDVTRDAELARAVERLGEGAAALGAEPYADPEFALSLGVNPARLGDLLGLLARRMAARQYTCPDLRDLGAQLTDLALQLGLGGHLLLEGFHGLHLRVDRFGDAELGGFAPVVGADGVAVVLHDAPGSLAQLLARMGELEVPLPADGEVAALAQAPPIAAGWHGGRLVATLGPAAEDRARALLSAAPAAPGPAPLVAWSGRTAGSLDAFDLLAEVDQAIEDAPNFVDGARLDGEAARVGAVSLSTDALYARADELAAMSEGEVPHAMALIDTAVDAFIARELVALSLLADREPSFDPSRDALLDAHALVERRLERLGKLRFSAAKREARGRRYKGELVPAPGDLALDVDAAHLGGSLLRSEAIAAEIDRRTTTQRKRTEVVDGREAVKARFVEHWGAVSERASAIRARLEASALEQQSMSAWTTMGRLVIVAQTRALPAPAAPAEPTGE